MKKRDIPKDILERVEAELMSSEELLWVGQPDPVKLIGGNTPRRASKMIALGLLLAMGLGFFFVYSASGTISPLMVMGAVFGILTAGIAASLYSNYRYGQRTIYAITGRRALVINDDETQSFSGRELQSITRRNRKDGTGDLIFESEYIKRVIPAGTVPVVQNETVERGFFHIENVAQVEALLLETFQHEDYSRRLVDTTDAEYRDDFDYEMQQQRSTQ